MKLFLKVRNFTGSSRRRYDHDDPFKGMVYDGEDDSVVDELEFDLNQLREARPDLALDADGLVAFDREVATNKS